jgi:predicted Rossmann fold nucleotide-binding protein DprA/Smf involved in DNA uptake
VLHFLEGERPTEVVSGGAKGIDFQGEEYANCRGIPVKKFIADWYANGKAAGPIRNKQMARYSDGALIIWDGSSKGSSNMKEEMLKLNKKVFEVIIKTYND